LPIHLDRRTPGLAVLTLDSPARLNAYDRADLAALDAVLTDVEDDPRVRCLLVSGRGRAFCAGADLAFIDEIRALPEPAQAAALALSPGVVGRLARLRCPTVAAVHGAAFGGGACLALACDEVVMADSATMGLIFTDLGLPGGDSAATWLVSRRTGTRVAWRLLALGARLDAGEAHRLGLADVVAPAEDVVAVATERAERYIARSPHALAVTKRQVLRLEKLPGSVDDALRTEHLEMLAAFRHPDLAEGLAAAREKRPPGWTADPIP
jgi:enoyl-CoA hydratase